MLFFYNYNQKIKFFFHNKQIIFGSPVLSFSYINIKDIDKQQQPNTKQKGSNVYEKKKIRAGFVLYEHFLKQEKKKSNEHF